MAGPFPMSDFEIELSPDGTNWTAYSTHAQSVTPGGGERARGEAFTAGRDVPYITTGKRNAMEYTVRVLYTTGPADLYTVVRGYYLNKSETWLRYSPEGGASGDNRITIGPGLITTCPPPAGDAGSGDAMALEFTLVGEDESDDTVP
jgi:hypothetical protein